MRINSEMEKYRLKTGLFASEKEDLFGCFIMPYKNYEITIFVSCGTEEIPWEHVSVSLKNRCPNWEEMSLIKDLFWDEDECVMQLHPPKYNYINNHPYCLHLWRPKNREIPLPPSITVGYKSLNIK